LMCFCIMSGACVCVHAYKILYINIKISFELTYEQLILTYTYVLIICIVWMGLLT
jgi:hypothetical protein